MAQDICPKCSGRGYYLGKTTVPDFFSGRKRYKQIEAKITCEVCGGRGTIWVPDPEEAEVSARDATHLSTSKEVMPPTPDSSIMAEQYLPKLIGRMYEKYWLAIHAGCVALGAFLFWAINAHDPYTSPKNDLIIGAAGGLLIPAAVYIIYDVILGLIAFSLRLFLFAIGVAITFGVGYVIYQIYHAIP